MTQAVHQIKVDECSTVTVEVAAMIIMVCNAMIHVHSAVTHCFHKVILPVKQISTRSWTESVMSSIWHQRINIYIHKVDISFMYAANGVCPECVYLSALVP